MNKNTLLTVIFCFILLLFFLLLSYKTVLFFTELTAAQQNTIDFVDNQAKLDLDYTTKEVSHLEDVQKVTKIINYLFYLSLLILTLILTYYQKNKKQIKRSFFFGGITTVAFLIIILFFYLINFSSAFRFFHQIFFPQGNWTFPADSLLIQTFPLEFFMDISRNILLLALILGSLFILISIVLKNGYQNKGT